MSNVRPPAIQPPSENDVAITARTVRQIKSFLESPTEMAGYVGDMIRQGLIDGGDAPKHTHSQAEIVDLTTDLANKQPLDATLTGFAGVTTAADQVIYATGVDTFAVAPLTAFGRSVIDDADAAAMMSTLGHAYCMLDADYTLASSTTAQKLFNVSTNGAVTLTAGTYHFDSIVRVEGMSATSGNAALGFAGTATIAGILNSVIGFDAGATTSATAASMVLSPATTVAAPVVIAGTGTTLAAKWGGLMRISTGGTIIPSITLTTASAASVVTGSHIVFRRVGNNALTGGSWS